MPPTKTKRVKTNVVSRNFYDRVIAKASKSGRIFFDNGNRQILLPRHLMPNNTNKEIITLRLTKTFKVNANLADITNRAWRSSKKRSANCLYVLGIYKDIVVSVFKVTKTTSDKIQSKRTQFVLTNVPSTQKAFFVLKRLHPRKIGERNPVKYYSM